MDAIKRETRREVFEEITVAQRYISLASGTLGTGNDEIRKRMVDAQVVLADVVSKLWELPLTNP